MTIVIDHKAIYSGIILDIDSANERHCYSVAASLIG